MTYFSFKCDVTGIFRALKPELTQNPMWNITRKSMKYTQQKFYWGELKIRSIQEETFKSIGLAEITDHLFSFRESFRFRTKGNLIFVIDVEFHISTTK